MSSDREARVQGPQRATEPHRSLDANAGSSRGMHHLQSVQRARAAIAGNLENRQQFEADPAAYLQRFGLAPDSLENLDSPLQAQAAPAPATSTPHGSIAQVQVRQSPIHGDGVFSDKGLQKGAVVGKLLNERGNDVSPMASKVNHSDSPNVLPTMEGGEMVLKAVRDVSPSEEVISSYNFPGRR